MISVPHLAKSGYMRVSVGNGRRQLHHRWLTERRLGRKLHPGEDVHHINGVKHDNRLENLVVLSHAEHMAIHHKQAKVDWSQIEVPRTNWHGGTRFAVCMLSQCNKPQRTRGLCNKHYVSYWHNWINKGYEQ